MKASFRGVLSNYLPSESLIYCGNPTKISSHEHYNDRQAFSAKSLSLSLSLCVCAFESSCACVQNVSSDLSQPAMAAYVICLWRRPVHRFYRGTYPLEVIHPTLMQGWGPHLLSPLRCRQIKWCYLTCCTEQLHHWQEGVRERTDNASWVQRPSIWLVSYEKDR